MDKMSSEYIGFTYNGVHSSELGILRVSDGSRFNENLLPTLQDKTVQVQGGDGTFYFGSYYTQRQITVSFAFDRLTETEFEKLRLHFGDKKIHDLVFDERPYKTYQAKVTGTASIKYIPFEENTSGNLGRIYKGEGSIQFTCYQPYAICKNKYLDKYDDFYQKKEEWSAASGLLETQGDFDAFNTEFQGIKTYNPGVKEADWILYIDFPKFTQDFSGCDLIIEGAGALRISNLKLKTKGYDNQNRDQRISINSKTNLVEGWRLSDDNKTYVKSGNLYNEHVILGDFFKIPIITDKTNGKIFSIKLVEPNENLTFDLAYNYYYY